MGSDTLTQLPLDGSVVKMKGLPFKASNEDVLKFYGGFSIKSSSIYMKRHPDGRPSGEVRCKRQRDAGRVPIPRRQGWQRPAASQQRASPPSSGRPAQRGPPPIRKRAPVHCTESSARD